MLIISYNILFLFYITTLFNSIIFPYINTENQNVTQNFREKRRTHLKSTKNID